MNKVCALWVMLVGLCAWPVHAATEVQEVQRAGLTAWLIEDHSIPMVTVSLRFHDAGYASDPQEKQGRAAMVARMMKESAGEYSAASFTKALEEQAIKFSSEVGRDALSLNARMTKPAIGEAFRLLSIALLQPQFPDDDLQRVREEFAAQIKALNESPHYHAGRALSEAMFGDHPYANKQLGTIESLLALSADDLRTYQSRYLTKENVSISVVGAISAEELGVVLESAFAQLPEVFQPEQLVEQAELLPAPAYTATDMDVPQTVVYFAMPGLKRSDPDFYAAYVLLHVLGGNGLNSILPKAVREDAGLAYAVDMNLAIADKAQLIEGGLSTRTDGVEESLEIIEEVLEEVASGSIDEAMLSDAKAYLTGAFPLSLVRSGVLVNYLQSMQHYELGMDYLAKRNSYIEAVNLEGLHRVAKRLLSQPRYVALAGQGAKAQIKQLAKEEE